jgi:CRISPR/Cas system CMR-associated protein Cmr3 (group 5 of RAMP superfamily)
VFVDNYCLAAVENHERTLLKRVSRTALHTINSIFPPPEVTGHVNGKDSISRKKVERGDVRFAPTKEMLGFELDGKKCTVKLPKAKSESMVAEIKALCKKPRVRLQRMQRIVGRLQ